MARHKRVAALADTKATTTTQPPSDAIACAPASQVWSPWIESHAGLDADDLVALMLAWCARVAEAAEVAP